MCRDDFEAEEAWVEPHIWVWVWVALAVILGIAEILTTGLYVLPFAVGAAVAAVLEFLRPGSVTWQWAAFIGISSVLFIAIHRRRRTRDAASANEMPQSAAQESSAEQSLGPEDATP